MEYLVLTIGWIVFGLTHSVLLLPRVKSRIQSSFSLSNEVYRLVYSILSILQIGIIIAYQIQIEPEFLWSKGLVSQIIGVIGVLGSVLLLLSTLRRYSSAFDFLGLNAFNLLPKKEEKSKKKKNLIISGWNARMRHPIYTFTLLAFWFALLLTPTVSWLILCIINTGYVVIGIPLEEEKLINEFGQSYIEYQKNVPALIPKIKT